LAADAALTFAVRCSYALVGATVAGDLEALLGTWTSSQDTMASLRNELGLPRAIDLYLVLVVPEVDEKSLHAVSRVIGDTHVCRKILLERRDRSPADVLSDLPFFDLAELQVDAGQGPSLEALPEELIADLAARAAPVVLDRLLEGQYSSGIGRSRDET
jgi:hypothetical protein